MMIGPLETLPFSCKNRASPDTYRLGVCVGPLSRSGVIAERREGGLAGTKRKGGGVGDVDGARVVWENDLKSGVLLDFELIAGTVRRGGLESGSDREQPRERTSIGTTRLGGRAPEIGGPPAGSRAPLTSSGPRQSRWAGRDSRRASRSTSTRSRRGKPVTISGLRERIGREFRSNSAARGRGPSAPKRRRRAQPLD